MNPDPMPIQIRIHNRPFCDKIGKMYKKVSCLSELVALDPDPGSGFRNPDPQSD
jgi:hypothetical protein